MADPAAGRVLPGHLRRRADGEGPRRRPRGNKAAYLVVGVDTDGIKHVLGIWIANTEGAKFWLTVFTELRNRGVRRVLIACCDGLEGLPEAIETIWPYTIVQTCVVHLIRASHALRLLHRPQGLAAALRPIYTAANADAAAMPCSNSPTPHSGASTRPPSRSGNGPGNGSSRSWVPARDSARSSTPPTRSLSGALWQKSGCDLGVCVVEGVFDAAVRPTSAEVSGGRLLSNCDGRCVVRPAGRRVVAELPEGMCELAAKSLVLVGEFAVAAVGEFEALA